MNWGSRIVLALCGVLCGAMALSNVARAEGSRSLHPAGYTGVRGVMSAGYDNTAYGGVARNRQFLYVYAQAGEYILLGSRNRSNGGDIFVYDPQSFGLRGDETIPAANFTCSDDTPPAGSYSGAGRGTIATRAQELAGPSSADGNVLVPGGFLPCAYLAPVTGIYGVRYTGATSGGVANTGTIDPPQVLTSNLVSAWDVTVRNGADSIVDLDGRLFTYAWVIRTGSNGTNFRLFNSLYYASSDGYRYRQIFRGTDPFAAAFYANAAGFLDSNGAPLYKDMRGSDGSVSAGTSFAAGVTSQRPQFPIFFSAITPGAVEAERTLTALGIPLVPPVPELANPTFAGNVGGNQSTVSAGGLFQFDTVNTLTYEIVISLDGVNFDPALAGNRVLTGIATTGNHNVIWDGRDNTGTPFPAGNYDFRITGRNGEIHFPIVDLEGNVNGGPTLLKLNGSQDSTVYFDDRGYRTANGTTIGQLNGHLCGAGHAQEQPTPNHSLLGLDSDSATYGSGRYYRHWAGSSDPNTDCSNSSAVYFGTAKGLDLWALERSPLIQLPIEIIPTFVGVDVGTQVSATAMALPGETVFGTFVFSNNSDTSATGVTYAVTIGDPSDPTTCPASVNFSLLPAGVTATYNAATCSVSFTNMPGTLAPGQSLIFNFNYVVGPAMTGPVPVDTTIAATNETPGAPSPNTASAQTGIPAIDATNDDYSGQPISSNTGGTTPSVFDNDTLDGVPFVAGDVDVTMVDNGGLAGATINPDGTIAVPAGTPAGSYTITYQICSDTQPTLCDTATATVVVIAGVVDDPLLCDGTFYQAREISSISRLFAIDRSASPYTLTELYSIGVRANAMGYNPVDDHLYILRNSTTSANALFRLGASGPVDLNGAAPGFDMPVAGLPNAGFDGADFDEQGNYFVFQGSGTAIYRIAGVTGPTPAPAATAVPLSADPAPPPGYTGVATILIGDVAVHPTESTPGVTVVYATRQPEGGVQYLYRIAIANPGSGAPTAVASRIATNLPNLASAFGSLFFDVSGTLYGYYNQADNIAGFYTFNTATGNAVSVSGAEPASSSDGGTCSFAEQTIDVVKAAGTPTIVDATTFEVPYSLVVGNLGTVVTPNVQVSDNLAMTFASGSPALTIVAGPTAAAPCTVNSGFDGVTDFALLSGSDDLAPGESCAIGFTVRVSYATLADVPSAEQENTAYASSTSGVAPNPGYTFPGGTPVPPVGLIAADESTDAPVLPGTPAGDEPTPTPVQFPYPPRVSIDKSASPPGALIPGGTVIYTVVATNTGSVAAPGTIVADAIPTGITSVTWLCAASGGAVCPAANGTGALNETIATFPAGSAVTWTLTATVAANPPATIVNTASATPPGGLCFPGDSAPPCTDSTSNTPVPIISISKSASEGVALPGGVVTWSVIVSNTGSVPADGTTVVDAVPAGIDATTWTCTASGGAACATASGAGAINEVIPTFPVGAQVTFTITGDVSAAPPASVTNLASATPPGGGICSDGTAAPCEADVSLPAAPQVAVTKTADPPGTLVPGGSVAYTIIVSNDGAVAAPGTTVTDAFPAGIVAANWTCVASGGAVCPNATSGGTVLPPAPMIDETIATFPAGGELTYTVIATVSATPPAVITNTVNVNPPGGVCLPANSAPPCSDTVGNTPVPIVDLDKTAKATVAIPGGTVVYTLTARNTGSVPANGTVVADPMPAGLVAPFDWTCVASNGAVCPNATGTGDINETIAIFPAGGEVVWTITATVADTPPSPITNTAAATPPGGGICADGGAAPCDATVTLPVAPQVSVTKTADVDVAVPGGTVVWTVTVSNTGSVAAPGTLVSDPVPAGITATTWTCAASGGAVCPNASGAGSINETIATFPAGGELVYTIDATVATPAPLDITNTVAVTPPGEGRCLPGNGVPPCSDSVTTPSAPAVSILKSVVDGNGNGVAEPGETLTYSIQLSNSGGTAATGFGVTDPLDANTDFVSADNGGVHAAGVVTWSGLTVPANGSLTLTLVVTVDDPLPAGVTQIGNLVHETGAPPPDCTVSPLPPNCTLLPTPGAVSLVKALTGEDGAVDGVAEPGEQLTYTVTLANTGGSDVVAYGVTDDLDDNVGFVSADNGGTHAAGVVTWSSLTVPANGTLVLTVVTQVDAPIAPGVTQIANLAYETGTTPPACPPASPQCVITPTPGVVTLVKALSDEDGSVDGVAEPGEQLTYTITLANTGGSDVVAYGVTDELDDNVGFVSADNSGTHAAGIVTWNGLTVPANGTLVLTVVTQVDAPVPLGVTQIANLAYETGTTPPACPPAGPQCVITPTLGSVIIAKSLVAENGSVGGVAEPGEQLTYGITLTNTGGTPVTGYGVTDQLDANVTFVSADNGGAAAGSVVTWSGLTVPANGSLTLTVVVGVNSPIAAGVSQIANLAYETGTTPPTCPPAGTQCVITPTLGTVIIAKALTGENGDVDGVAEPGEQLSYTITLTNTGGSDVTGYGVTDQLDANTVFVSADNGGAHAGGVVTWTGLTVPANGSLTLSVVVAVADPLPAGVEQVANLAYETGTTPPACPPAGTQCVITPTLGSVTIVKALTGENGDVDGVAEPGEQLSYTITLTNTGGSDVTGYGVTDQLDAHTTFVSADNGGAHAGGVVTWTGLTVPANGSLTLNVVVAVADPLPAGVEQIANLAYETGTTPPACPPAGTQCVITPTLGTVTIAKAVADASGDGVAEPGELLTYTITLTNTGGSDVTGYGVTDPLDANTVFVSADNGGAHAGGVVIWTGLTVPANGSLVLVLVVEVDDPIAVGVEQIANLAYETGTVPPDCTATPTPGNCALIPVIPDEPAAEIGVVKTASAASATPGGAITYAITVSNTGPVAVDDVVITDPIPVGIASFSWTCVASGGATCPNAAGSGAISETVPTFPIGGELVYTVVAQLTQNPPPNVLNVVTVTPSGIVVCAPEGTPGPCSADVPVQIIGGPPTSPTPVPAGDRWALLLLGMLILLAGARGVSQRR
jgi:uncharacterized repeat protein (TIGR01451 family)